VAQERELPAAKRVALEIKKMWHCVKCGEDVEDHFDRCWNCQANRRGLRQFNHNHVDGYEDDRVRAIVNKKHKPMNCLRCNDPLTYAGTKKFPPGPSLRVFGDLGELLISRENIEMYVCQSCGHVEFFAFGD